MGDRANIVVHTGDDGKDVWLYTHWSGYRVPETLRQALAKGWRWTDPSYLARIIFDQLTTGQHGEETGYGISTGMCDNEHPILRVVVTDDCKGRVEYHPSVWGELATPTKVWGFAEFVALGSVDEPLDWQIMRALANDEE